MAADKDKEAITVIGSNTHVVGEVRGDESLLVRGRLEGKVQLSESLTVDAGGIVQADVEVKNATVSGVLVGSVVASESVRLLPKARVVGNITAPRVAIEAGAAYRGRLEMGEVDLAQRASARAARAQATPASASTTASKPAPRLTAPGSRPAASAAPRVVSVPARPSAAKTSGPAWARKKLKRR